VLFRERRTNGRFKKYVCKQHQRPMWVSIEIEEKMNNEIFFLIKVVCFELYLFRNI
jgi:hypothetical protein